MMRYRLMATYRGAPYEAGIGPSEADVVLFAACPPPEELGFEPATGHWRKQLRIDDVQALWESRPTGVFRGERCIVLDDLGDRLHIAYLGHDAYRAEQLGFWQVDRGVFELVTPRDDVTDIVEERTDYPGRRPGALPPLTGELTAVTAGPLEPVPPPAGGNGTPPGSGPQQIRLADLAAATLAHLASLSPPGGPGWDPAEPGTGPLDPPAAPAPPVNGAAAPPAGYAAPPAPDWQQGGQPPGSGVAMPPPEEEPLPLEAAARRAAAEATAAMRRQREPAPGPQPPPAAGPPPGPEPEPDTGAGQPRRRRAARDRVATQRIFSELASLAAIPPAAYAIGEEVDRAMCLVQAGDSFEVFTAMGGARHEVRAFRDEESAYFYLFGVLAADAVRTGRLAPRPG
ncbi:MAG TPA: hypothetical protein VH637_13500 [Streptosporangiaceae bacterium]|jgi:hypothetical protein